MFGLIVGTSTDSTLRVDGSALGDPVANSLAAGALLDPKLVGALGHHLVLSVAEDQMSDLDKAFGKIQVVADDEQRGRLRAREQVFSQKPPSSDHVGADGRQQVQENILKALFSRNQAAIGIVSLYAVDDKWELGLWSWGKEGLVSIEGAFVVTLSVENVEQGLKDLSIGGVNGYLSVVNLDF